MYGLLKSGQSLTPFILNAYLDSPIEKSKKHDEKIKKAIEFLRKKNNKGIHGKHDPHFLDYPNYSTSYALQCFLKFGSEQDQKNIEQSIVYLQNQQFSENVGFLLNLRRMEDGDLVLIKNQALEVLSTSLTRAGF